MEPRRLLSADLSLIQIGAVYYEDGSGEDQAGDTVEITWSGGAPGTQLAEIVIDTDKEGDGLSNGDAFFDISPGGLGAYDAIGLSILEHTGFDVVSASVTDGGTTLIFQFAGFDAGETLVFSVDMDEQGYPEPNAVVEGKEYEGSLLAATFTADHFFDAVGMDMFLDDFNDALSVSGLDLPPDEYVPPGSVPRPVYTAAAIFPVEQTPLPITLAGTVFEDLDADNVQDADEFGLPDVELTLYELVGEDYVPTGDTTLTDENGDYAFEGMSPGTYRVVETQPDGYLSVGAQAGTVDGLTHGVVVSADILGQIELFGGEDSIDNDFAEVWPASLSGHVYHDADNDGLFDPDETGIGNVTISVERVVAPGLPSSLLVVQTDPTGFWLVENLMPGEYRVVESQPDEYIDGLDAAGTAGGVAHNPGDRIDGIHLLAGEQAEDYDFGELLWGSIRGRVHAELNMDCIWQSGEPLLAGVTIYLLDASGARIASTLTDSLGEYAFVELVPGAYGVEEIQPEGYLQGRTHAGSEGGTVDGDFITEVVLPAGVDAVEYNFCELVPAQISGYVFQDGGTIRYGFNDPVPDPASVRDGQFTADDKPIAGVRVVLGDRYGEPVLDEGGQPITTVTNAQGYYKFTMLRPGVYTILEDQPDAYVDGIDTPGTKGGVAVNPNSTIDPLMLSQLTVDPQNDAIIQIAMNPGDNAQSYNFSEVRLERQPFFPPHDPPDPPVDPDPSPPVPYQSPPLAQYFSVAVPSAGSPFYGGSGGPNGYTWHLSVINNGQPRRALDYDNASFNPSNPYFDPITWTGRAIDQSRWVLADGSGGAARQCAFGLPGATPVTGDWDGDGVTEIGIFIDGCWFLDLNGNGTWDQDDLWIQLGHQGDLPVTGDWDGDGKTDVGIFGPAWIGDLKAIQLEPGQPDVQNRRVGRHKNLPPNPQEATVGWRNMKRTAQGPFRADLIDHVFHFGAAGDRPIAGDWNGDGVATLGVYRKGIWFLDVDGNGQWSEPDVYVELGQETDLPVVGDWNGDGVTDLGVYRQGKWHLDTNGDRRLDAHDKVFELGGAEDVPVVGDFNGDGMDEAGVYQDGALKTQP